MRRAIKNANSRRQRNAKTIAPNPIAMENPTDSIILEIEGFKYFAPLSSFKPKHKRLCDTDDFIKIGVYAVINLNNMFPAPLNICKPVLISDIKNEHYKNLIRAEYRIIKQKAEQIISNARVVYNHKLINDGKSKLSQRCNNFKLLEEKCREYKSK